MAIRKIVSSQLVFSFNCFAFFVSVYKILSQNDIEEMQSGVDRIRYIILPPNPSP